MSWSIHFIGSKDNIVKALKEEVEKFTNADSKAEYEKHLPGIVAMMEANVNPYPKAGYSLMANGHVAKDYASFNIQLKPLDGNLV